MTNQYIINAEGIQETNRKETEFESLKSAFKKMD